MRNENVRMQNWLRSNGINARVKYLSSGSLKGSWRLSAPNEPWTEELVEKLSKLGFDGFDGRPLNRYSGNGGMFSVFVRGHNEMLREASDMSRITVAKKLLKLARELTATSLNDVRRDLKKLGFKVSIKSFSHGPHAIFMNSSGEKMPSIFTAESQEEWQPLIDYLKDLDAPVTDNSGQHVYGFGKKRDK